MRGRRHTPAPRYQRYVGTELAAVLVQVQAAHGTDARIVGVDRVRQGGVGGFFARECYEVTVEADPAHRPPAPGRVAPAPGHGPDDERIGAAPPHPLPPPGPTGAAGPPAALSFADLLARRLADTDDLDDDAVTRAELRRSLAPRPAPRPPAAAALPPPALAFHDRDDVGDNGGWDDDAYDYADGTYDRDFDPEGDEELGLVDFGPDDFRPAERVADGPANWFPPGGSGADPDPDPDPDSALGPDPEAWADRVDDGVDPDGVDLDFEPGYPVIVDEKGFVTVPGLVPGHDDTPDPAGSTWFPDPARPAGPADLDLVAMGLDDIDFGPSGDPASIDLDTIDLVAPSHPAPDPVLPAPGFFGFFAADAIDSGPAAPEAWIPGPDPDGHDPVALDPEALDPGAFDPGAFESAALDPGAFDPADGDSHAFDPDAFDPGSGRAVAGGGLADTGLDHGRPAGPAGPAGPVRARFGSVDDWSLIDLDHRLVPTGPAAAGTAGWGPAEAGGLAFWARYDQARAEAELLDVPPVALSAVVGSLAATVDVVQRCQAEHWSGGCEVFVLSERVGLSRGGPDRSWRFVHHPDELVAVVTGQQAEFPLLVIDVPAHQPLWLRPLLDRLRQAGLGLVRYVLDGDPTDEDLATWHGEIGRPAVLDLATPLPPARILELVDRGEPITSVAGLPLSGDLLLALRAEVSGGR